MIVQMTRDYIGGCRRSFPDKIAIVDGERRLTWQQLDERSTALAAALRQLGVKQGQVVAVIGHDHAEVVEHFYACVKQGYVRVGVNWRYSAREISQILNDCDAACVIVQAQCAEAISSALDELRGKGIPTIGFGGPHAMDEDYEDLITNAGMQTECPALDGDDRAVISYTTGTTGRPKGVELTHQVLRDALIQTVIGMGLRHDDVWGVAAPISGSPIRFAVCGSVTGMTTVLPGGDFDAKRVLDHVAAHRITATMFVPTMLRRVVEHAEVGHWDLSSLRLVAYGSAPTPPALLRRAAAVFDCEFQGWYGSSEVPGGIACLRNIDHRIALECEPELLKSCGFPSVHLELTIRESDGALTPPGEAGEIWLRGATVTRAYFNRPEENASRFESGWFRTGDIAKRDERGYLYLVDRKDFMIISGGYNVYPSTIEQVIDEHPSVREALVVGVPHPEWGEAVVAMVSLRNGADIDAESIKEHCRRRLGRWEVPKYIDLVAEVPHGKTGKLDRFSARDEYRRGVRALPWQAPVY